MAPPTVLTDADYWYDATDITSASQQTIPNQGTVGTADATRGKTSSSESSDPTWAENPNRLECDGTDDHIRLPNGASPQSYLDYNTGQFTVLMVVSSDVEPSTFKGLYACSTDGSSVGAVNLHGASGNAIKVRVQSQTTGTVTKTAKSTVTIDEIMAVGLVIDEGDLETYNDADGVSGSPASLSALTDGIDYNAGLERASCLTCDADSGFLTWEGNWYSTVIWHNRALTETELNDTADYLIAQTDNSATATPATIAATAAIPTGVAAVGAAPATATATVTTPAPAVSIGATPATIAAVITLPMIANSGDLTPATITIRDTGHTVTAKEQT